VNTKLEGRPDISVIVPVSERYDDVRQLYSDYKTGLNSSGRSCEFIYVLDGHFPTVLAELERLHKEGENIRIIKLTRWFGEATALSTAFEIAKGDIILTLPAYYQVDPRRLPEIIRPLAEYDMVIARRYPRIDSWFNRFQTRAFHSILHLVTDATFHDLGCGVRAFKRQVAAEVPLYGDQHRFLPLLATRQGFRIKEVDIPQSPKEKPWRIYRPGVYPRRLLDLLTVFFLVKFTKKPLRFFGLIGVATFALGAIVLVYVIIQRLFMGMPLAERPALLLSSLLVVLGVQIFALGLIGELIIFTHAKEIKEYTIQEIIN
jgi:glycosyltransferase involved in cell wall biosynthesis